MIISLEATCVTPSTIFLYLFSLSRKRGIMYQNNWSAVTEFLLLGLSEKSEQQYLLFNIFLGMYLATMLGNLLIILAIGSDTHLHMPCTSSWPTSLWLMPAFLPPLSPRCW